MKAQIHNLTSLSAHGDYNEILQWLQQDPALKPDKVYVTHGEPVASDQMRRRLHETLGWDAEVPELGAEVDI